MNFLINKDTKLFGSFSGKKGSKGATFFNTYFQENDINAVYIPFECTHPADILDFTRIGGFSGFALGAPNKIAFLDYLTIVTPNAWEIGSVNTVLTNEKCFHGYNTDYLAIKKYLTEVLLKPYSIKILGRGGYGKAVAYTCDQLSILYEVFSRLDIEQGVIDTLSAGTIVFNATPAKFVYPKDVLSIESDPETQSGSLLAQFNMEEQLRLYKSCL